MRSVCVSPKVVLVKVIFLRSPTTVDLHSGWVGVDVCATDGATQIASATMHITPQDLVGMPHYPNFPDSNLCAMRLKRRISLLISHPCIVIFLSQPPFSWPLRRAVSKPRLKNPP